MTVWEVVFFSANEIFFFFSQPTVWVPVKLDPWSSIPLQELVAGASSKEVTLRVRGEFRSV